MVQLKDSICFKWVQRHGSTQGFNLLQMSPKTWFISRIQFASNESKDMVHLKDSICFKWDQRHGSTQGFKLLQMSPKTWFNSRIQFASNESKNMVHLKDSICFKQVQRHGSTQGFNLLQMSPNWFLGIWTLEPHLKWALHRIHFKCWSSTSSVITN